MRWAALLLALLPAAAGAHVLDEYVQHSTIGIAGGRVSISLRLQPGAEVAGKVLAALERDGKPGLSREEVNDYARRVLGDLSLTLDGQMTGLNLLFAAASDPAALRQGTGDIRIVLFAAGPRSPGRHTLGLVNRHLAGISAYVVNSLAPDNPGTRILKQSRNPDQSSYTLDYELTAR